MPSSLTHESKCAIARSPRTRGRGQLQNILRLKRRARGSAGFTLVETIVALTILSVGVLGVAAGLLSAMKMSSQSRAKTEAIYLAEQQLELFRTMTVGEVVALATGGSVVHDNSGNPIQTEIGRAHV